MASKPSTASKASAARNTSAGNTLTSAKDMPAQRNNRSQRKAPSTPTTARDTTSTQVMYYAGMKPADIKADLIKAGKLLNGSAVTYARKMAEAFARNVHGELGVAWDVFVKDISEDIKWDKTMWPTMVQILRDAGMENREVAEAAGVSEITVKRLNSKAGRVNVNRRNGQITSVKASNPKDGSVKAEFTPPARNGKITDRNFQKWDASPVRTPRGTVAKTDIATVVKGATDRAALVKELAKRDDALDLLLDLTAALRK